MHAGQITIKPWDQTERASICALPRAQMHAGQIKIKPWDQKGENSICALPDYFHFSVSLTSTKRHATEFVHRDLLCDPCLLRGLHWSLSSRTPIASPNTTTTSTGPKSICGDGGNGHGRTFGLHRGRRLANLRRLTTDDPNTKHSLERASPRGGAYPRRHP